MARRHHSEQGAAVIEFALVTSLLLMLIFGVTEFGLAYHVRQGLQAGAREGARVASLPHTTRDEIKDRVRESLSGVDTGLENCPPTSVGEYCITVTPNSTRPCNTASGRRVTVQVDHRTRIDIPVWASPELTLQGKGVFRCEV